MSDTNVEIQTIPAADNKTLNLVLTCNDEMNVAMVVKALSSFIKHNIKKYNLDPMVVLSGPADSYKEN